MYPLIHLGSAEVQTSTIAWIIALWLGTYLANRECQQRKVAGRDDVWNVVAIAAVIVVVFGRLAYVAQHPSDFSSDLLQVFMPAPGSLSLDVGALLGLGAAFAYLQFRKIPLAHLLDTLAPGALVALATVAIGQWLSGEAYGGLSNLPWAMTLGGELRHPVQLYDAFVALAGCMAAWRFARTKSMRAGWIALFAIAWYSAGRLFIDAFRDEETLLPGGYRFTQVIALTVLVVSLGIMSHTRHSKNYQSGMSDLVPASEEP